MSLLSWAVRRKRGEPAGGFPDAAKYPRFDLALVGSLPAIEQVTEALATLAEIADGAGVDVETRLRLSGISRRMSAALSEQESLLGLHRPLNRIPPYEAASLSAQFGVVIRQLDPASSGPTAAMVA
jgi:hypothetical protein